MATVPLEYHTQQIHYFRRQVTYADTPTHSITRYWMGKLKTGSQIVFCLATIKTGFSATGTRVLTVGSNGTTANDILTAITEETATAVMPLIGAKLSYTSDKDVFAKLTTTGTAAAAGVAEIVLGFVPPTAEGD